MRKEQIAHNASEDGLRSEALWQLVVQRWSSSDRQAELVHSAILGAERGAREERWWLEGEGGWMWCPCGLLWLVPPVGEGRERGEVEERVWRRWGEMEKGTNSCGSYSRVS